MADHPSKPAHRPLVLHSLLVALLCLAAACGPQAGGQDDEHAGHGHGEEEAGGDDDEGHEGEGEAGAVDAHHAERHTSPCEDDVALSAEAVKLSGVRV